MFSAIDDFLLRRSQKAADRFSELTGQTKFWLEKFFFIASNLFLESFLVFISLSVDAGFPYILTALVFLWTVIGIWSMERREKVFLNTGKLMFTAESQPIIRRPYLVVNLATTVLTIIGHVEFGQDFLLYATASLFLSLFALYFSACTPKPPSKGRIRTWFEKLLSSTRTTPVAAGGASNN